MKFLLGLIEPKKVYGPKWNFDIFAINFKIFNCHFEEQWLDLMWETKNK